MSDALLLWEQAEVVRSSEEAARAAVGVRATAPAILHRYANPSASTVFPLEYAYHLVGNVAGKTVLDFGCGTGENAAILAARGAQVYAMDISPDLLNLAALRASLDGLSDSITTVCGSAHAIPLPDASVDLVFGNAILHHLDLDLTARETYRVLKPGGRAIFKEPIRNSRTLTVLRKLIPYQQAEISPYERPLRWADIERFAAQFRIGRYRSFRLPLVALAKTVRLPHRTVDRMRHWEHALLESWPLMTRYAGIGVFELLKLR